MSVAAGSRSSPIVEAISRRSSMRRWTAPWSTADVPVPRRRAADRRPRGRAPSRRRGAWHGRVVLEMAPADRRRADRGHARPAARRAGDAGRGRRRRRRAGQHVGGNVKSLMPERRAASALPVVSRGERRRRRHDDARRALLDAISRGRCARPGARVEHAQLMTSGNQRRPGTDMKILDRRRQPRDAADRHPHAAPGRATTATTSSRPRTARTALTAVPRSTAATWCSPTGTCRR